MGNVRGWGWVRKDRSMNLLTNLNYLGSIKLENKFSHSLSRRELTQISSGSFNKTGILFTNSGGFFGRKMLRYIFDNLH